MPEPDGSRRGHPLSCRGTLRIFHALLGRGVPLHTIEHRIQQYQTADALRRDERGLQDNAPAHGQSDKHCAVDPKSIEQRKHVRAVRVRDAGGGLARSSETAQIAADDSRDVAKGDNLLVPHPAIE
jgi:hypothetical protein